MASLAHDEKRTAAPRPTRNRTAMNVAGGSAGIFDNSKTFGGILGASPDGPPAAGVSGCPPTVTIVWKNVVSTTGASPVGLPSDRPGGVTPTTAHAEGAGSSDYLPPDPPPHRVRVRVP